MMFMQFSKKEPPYIEYEKMTLSISNEDKRLKLHITNKSRKKEGAVMKLDKKEVKMLIRCLLEYLCED